MDDGLSQPGLRFALAMAVLAAVIVLAGFFPEGVRYGCLGVIALAALASADERNRRGGGWWMLLGVGAGMSIAGFAVAQLEDTVGGLIAVMGAALVVIGAVIGFPADPDPE